MHVLVSACIDGVFSVGGRCSGDVNQLDIDDLLHLRQHLCSLLTAHHSNPSVWPHPKHPRLPSTAIDADKQRGREARSNGTMRRSQKRKRRRKLSGWGVGGQAQEACHGAGHAAQSKLGRTFRNCPPQTSYRRQL